MEFNTGQHQGGPTTTSVQYNMARYARVAAVKYITKHFGNTRLAELTEPEKADLLGLLTAFYHQMGYLMFSDKQHAPEWPNIVGGTAKNLFHHLLKVNIRPLVEALSPDLADTVHEWVQAKGFANAGAFNNNDDRIDATAAQLALKEFINEVRDAWQASDNDYLKAWATDLEKVSTVAERTHKNQVLNAVLTAVKGFDMTQNLNPHTSASTRPAPPMYIGAAFPAPGVLAVVVESRKHFNALNAFVEAAPNAGQANGFNAMLGPLCTQHSWDGKNPTFTKTKNVGTW